MEETRKQPEAKSFRQPYSSYMMPALYLALRRKAFKNKRTVVEEMEDAVARHLERKEDKRRG